MPKMEVFFDYICPFCRKAHYELVDLLPQFPEIEIVWYPCESHPRPEELHPHTDLCARGFFYAKAHGVDPFLYHDRLYRAIQEEHKNVEDLSILTQLVSDLVEPESFAQSIRQGDYRKEAENANILAYEKSGVWAVPAYRMEGKKLDAAEGIGVTRESLTQFLKNA